MRYSKIYASFDAELQSIVTYARANQKRLDLAAAVITILEQDWQMWQASYAAYIDPDRQTTPVVLRTKRLHDDIESYLASFKRSLKYNPAVELTDQDYAKLFIHRNKRRRGHVAVPNVAPQVDLLETHHLVNRFEITDPNPPNQNHRALPPNASHIGRKLALVGPGGAVPKPAAYHALTQISKTIFELDFNPEEQGYTGYLIAWYVNNRGEAGPESEPRSFIIS